jgi:predicted membrane protein
MSPFTVTSYTWLAFAPVAIVLLIFVAGLILWQADFVFASGILAWGIVAGVLLLWAFGVFPIRGEYNQANQVMVVRIYIASEPDDPPEAFQEPAP